MYDIYFTLGRHLLHENFNLNHFNIKSTDMIKDWKKHMRNPSSIILIVKKPISITIIYSIHHIVWPVSVSIAHVWSVGTRGQYNGPRTLSESEKWSIIRCGYALILLTSKYFSEESGAPTKMYYHYYVALYLKCLYLLSYFFNNSYLYNKKK